MFFIQCLLVAILAGILRLDGRAFGQNLTEQPIIAGVLVGIIFGDAYTGLIMGATIQLVFLGVVSIGAATPPDALVGGIMGTVFAITTGMDAEAVIALAMPMGILGQMLGILCRIINTNFNGIIDKAASEGDTKKIDITLWTGCAIFFILTAVPVFLGAYYGADIVNAIIAALPKVVVDGLSRSSSLLPALGMALLMNYLYEKDTAPYLFLGFVLNAFVGIGTLGITFIGTIIAFILYNNRKGAKA